MLTKIQSKFSHKLLNWVLKFNSLVVFTDHLVFSDCVRTNDEDKGEGVEVEVEDEGKGKGNNKNNF